MLSTVSRRKKNLNADIGGDGFVVRDNIAIQRPKSSDRFEAKLVFQTNKLLRIVPLPYFIVILPIGVCAFVFPLSRIAMLFTRFKSAGSEE